MATTMEQVREVLGQFELHWHEINKDLLALPFRMERFQDAQGDPSLLVLLELAQDGETLLVRTHDTYSVSDEHREAVLRVAAMIQSRTLLVRFAYDDRSGSLVPTVHLPLRDAPLGASQLLFAVMALPKVLDQFDPVIRLALEEGHVDPALVDDPSKAVLGADVLDMLELLPVEVLEQAVVRVRGRDRSDEVR